MATHIIRRHCEGVDTDLEEFFSQEDAEQALKQYNQELQYARELTEAFWGSNHDAMTYHESEVVENQIQEALPPMRDKDFVFLWNLSAPLIFYTIHENSLI